MRNPLIKNVNTIALKFIKGDRNYKDVITVLKDHLGLEKDDLLGHGFSGKDSIHVLLATNEIYNSTVEHHANNFYDINNDTSIQIIDISTYKIKVTMKNVPFALPNTTLSNILASHGEVETVKTCYYPTKEGEEFLSGLQTMERFAIMKTISKPIPSTYFLNITQSYIYFSHPNQNTTCTKCGDTAHHGGECPVFKTTAPWKRNNVFNLPTGYFPNMPKSQAWLNQNIKMTSSHTHLLNTPNTEQVSFFDSLDFPKIQITSQVTLHNNYTEIATSSSTTIVNPNDAPKLAPNPRNEDDFNPILPLNEVESSPDANDTKSDKETTLEKIHLNALPLDKSLPNAELATTDDTLILEENPSNAHVLVKNQLNAVTVNTTNGSTLEKSHFNALTVQKDQINAVNVATDQALTLEKTHSNANTQEDSHNDTVSLKTDQDLTLEKHTQEKSLKNAEIVATMQVPSPEKSMLNKPVCDPILTSVTNQINKLSLDTNPENDESELHTKSSYSPPNLRLTTARKTHTNV